MRRRVDQPKRVRLVGRLPSLIRRPALGAWMCALVGISCNQETKTSTTRERSEIVKATGSAAEAPSSPPPVAATVAAALPPRRLCEGQLTHARDVPRKPISRKAALGVKPPGSLLSGQHWTWINLWAAWCAPCKEEMPRLQSFAARLAQSGSVLSLDFVSLDDDERQLEQFLGAQAEGGVKSTFWLREGHERDEWLAAAGLPRDPTLPVQLLVDPKGKVRCTVNGAVSESDYAEVASIVSGL
jgi:thiol-disulfide isomerase/thioredoxin